MYIDNGDLFACVWDFSEASSGVHQLFTDENRGHLLGSGFLHALVNLLEHYTDLIPKDK